MGAMRLLRRAPALLAAFATTAAGLAAASDEARSPTAAKAPAPEVRTVTGTIRAVAPGEHALTLDTSDGPVRLGFDLNTSVFLPERVGTVRALRSGTRVRASFGPGRHAYWIEVQAPSSARPAPEHRTREGRPVLAAPPDAELSGTATAPTGATDGDTAGAATDEVPGKPEPDPGTLVPPAPPGPALPPVRDTRGD